MSKVGCGQRKYSNYRLAGRNQNKGARSLRKTPEIGCGPGGILSIFAERGAVVTGYDLNAEYSADRPDGWPMVRTGTIDTALANSEKHDLVILSHVLEHMYEPVDALRKARSLVKDGGYLYIEVPGLRSFEKGHYSICGCTLAHPYEKDLMKEFVIAHNFEFDLSVLDYVLQTSSFSIVSATELVRVLARATAPLPSKQLATPGEALKNNHSRNLTYLIQLERKRMQYAVINSARRVLTLPYRALRAIATGRFRQSLRRYLASPS